MAKFRNYKPKELESTLKMKLKKSTLKKIHSTVPNVQKLQTTKMTENTANKSSVKNILTHS